MQGSATGAQAQDARRLGNAGTLRLSGMVKTARPWLAYVVAVSLALSLLAQLPHLADDAWQDEAATLMVFAAQGFAHAFSDYTMPNNHMLFSATLSLWWSRGDSVRSARLLPGLVWLLSMALMIASGRRTLGWPATALGSALWSGGALTAAFAVALRGYAFSWPCTLVAFAAAQAFVRDGAWRAGLLFALACAANLAILPTNALVSLVCVSAAWLSCRWEDGGARRAPLARALIALPLGLLGAAVYLPHREQLAQHLQHGFSAWSSAQIAQHWLLASSAQYLCLLPLLAYGVWLSWHARQSHVARDGMRAMVLLAVLIVLIPAFLALAPTPLVPRALVPLLPLWCLALGGVLAPACVALCARLRWPETEVLAAAALLFFALGRVVPACGGLAWRFPPGDDLCHQYYRDDYHPTAMLSAIATRFGAAAVLVDPAAHWALEFVQWNRSEHAVRLLDASLWAQAMGGQLPRLVVGDSAPAASALLRAITARTPHDMHVVLDSGYLKLYGVGWR